MSLPFFLGRTPPTSTADSQAKPEREDVQQPQRITLDDLWSKAEQLGRVEVDHEDFSGKVYRAEIRFTRPSGTTVMARGTSESIHEAMLGAIREAMTLGAEPRR